MDFKRSNFFVVISNTFGVFQSTWFSALLFYLIFFRDMEPSKYIKGYLIFLGVVFFFRFINWLLTKYKIDEDYFIFYQGGLRRSTTKLSLTKIQGINKDSNFIYKMLGLVSVRIETAGSAKASLAILLVSEKEAQRIEEFIFNKIGKPDKKEVKEKNYYKVSNKNLILYPTTSMVVIFQIIAIQGLYSQMNRFFPDFTQNIISKSKLLSSAFNIRHNMDFETIIYFSIFSILIILFAWSLSVVSNFLLQGNFTIRRHEENIYIKKGIVTTKEITIPIKRIQCIRIKETLIRQLFGYVSIQVDSIGYGDEKEKKTLIVPLMKKNEIDDFLVKIIPELNRGVSLYKSPKKALFLFLIEGLSLHMLVSILLTYQFEYGYLSFYLIPFTILISLLRHRDSGIGFKNTDIVLRTRMINLETIYFKNYNIQSIDFNEYALQQKMNVCDYEISIATDNDMEYIVTKHLPTEVQEEMIEWYFQIMKDTSNNRKEVD